MYSSLMCVVCTILPCVHRVNEVAASLTSNLRIANVKAYDIN